MVLKGLGTGGATPPPALHTVCAKPHMSRQVLRRAPQNRTGGRGWPQTERVTAQEALTVPEWHRVGTWARTLFSLTLLLGPHQPARARDGIRGKAADAGPRAGTRWAVL